MKDLILGFSDTYDNAKKFFTEVLSKKYNVIRDDKNPDYLIFGDENFGIENYSYDSTRIKKIFFTGENVRPKYFTHNYAITFDHENSPKHYRLPLYVLEMWAITKDSPQVTNDFYYLTNRKLDSESIFKNKKYACAYIQSNPNCIPRTKFVEFLLSKSFVNCAGPHLNNIGKVIPRDRALKIDFFSQHYFGVAFENGSHPGYVTEKLLDCYYANTIPIYWGSATVHRDFNPKSFINAADFKNPDDLYNYLNHLISNKKEYLDILTTPVFYDNIPNEFTNLNSFLNWFDIFVYGK